MLRIKIKNHFKNKGILCWAALMVILCSCNESISEKKTFSTAFRDSINTENIWNLPETLKEVSGIAYMGQNKIACVQDEDGIIFIYNLDQSIIEKEINFHGAGDYEGLSIVGNNAYILRSDGVLFEVENFLSAPAVREYPLGFHASHNLEGLAYDASGNRLLIVGKGDDPAFKDKKGIYSFDLKTKVREKNAVASIDLKDDKFNSTGKKKKKKKKAFQPSDIGVHPQTNEWYVLDRSKKQLLILSQEGIIRKLISLDRNYVYAPEGIDFSSTGEIYISSEYSKDKPATIVKFFAEYVAD